MNKLLTFKQAKEGRLREVANACPNSDDFRSQLNEATETLMSRGDWDGTVVPVGICLYNDCITWPRYVGSVRKLNKANGPIQTQNNWFAFLSNTYNNYCDAFRYKELMHESTGNAPTYEDIPPGGGQRVRLYTYCSADVGKVTRIYGTGSDGQPLRQLVDPTDPSGDWEDGITLTAAIPYVSTTVDIASVHRVQREITQCHQTLNAYNTSTGDLVQMADYAPSETDPWYSRSRLVGGCTQSCQNSCDGIAYYVAMVKLQFIPVVTDDDLVLISNMRALKLMIQAIRKGEAGEIDNAVKYELMAIKELNHELEDANPSWQTPTQYQPMAGMNFGNRCI